MATSSRNEVVRYRNDRHIHRTRESEAARQRARAAREFALTAEDLVPRDPDSGEPYSASSLRRFRARRERCRHSLPLFAKTYCMGDGGYLEVAPSGKLVEILEQIQRAVEGEGKSPIPYHIRMSRGHGKTSFVKCAIAWCLAYGLRKYVVAVSAGREGAAAIIDEVWTLFEQSQTLYQDFPEICIPIRLAQGNSARAKRINYNEIACGMRKSAAEIRMPRMDGYKGTGGILAARSFLGGTRGLVHGKLRPDLILFDDIQTDEMADSAGQLQAAERKIDGAFLGLAGHRKKIAALMCSTPIRPNDLSEMYAGKDSWQTYTYPMISAWPTCWRSEKVQDHWAEYLRLKDRDTVSGNDEAGEYYRQHRAAMDEGAEVLNLQNYDASAGEISALQHAINLYYTQGAEAFAAEYQMQPVRPTSVYDLTPQLVRSRLNHTPSFVLPANYTNGIVATVDVMTKAETGLRWGIFGFGPSNSLTCVAYGRHPASGKPMYAPQAPVDQQDAAVASALRTLLDQLAAARIVGANGSTHTIDCVGVDAGYRMRTVISVCETEKLRRRFARIDAMRGMSWDHFTPVTASGQLRAGVRAADEYAYASTSKFGPYLTYHADYFSEAYQRAFFCEPGTAGSLSLFGDSPEVHKVFADECCADKLIEKDKTRGGVDTWRWGTHGPNHFGDCCKEALALGYWHRLWLITPSAATTMPPSRLPSATAPWRPPLRQAPRRANTVRFA